MVTVTFFQDWVDEIEERRSNVADTNKRIPEIKSKLLIKILDYVQKFEAEVYRIDPRNWAWE